jgi:hypothetical protein
VLVNIPLDHEGPSSASSVSFTTTTHVCERASPPHPPPSRRRPLPPSLPLNLSFINLPVTSSPPPPPSRPNDFPIQTACSHQCLCALFKTRLLPLQPRNCSHSRQRNSTLPPYSYSLTFLSLHSSSWFLPAMHARHSASAIAASRSFSTASWLRAHPILRANCRQPK